MRLKFQIPAAVLTLASVVAACTVEQRGTPAGVTGGPTGEVVEGLDAFYGQTLEWEECPPYASTEFGDQAFGLPDLQCTRAEVPLDYADPDGEVIKIGVVRKQATGDRIGALMMNPGGPGVSGMELAAAMTFGGTMSTLNENFDIVGFDPRGVGASEPIVQCLTDEEFDEDRADDGEVDGSPEGVERQEAEAQEFADKCVERTEHGEAMLANIGTRDVVRDMDVLRSVLGDEQLTYLGYSYGTRIGYAYAEAFPQNVRALILDGALDPEQDLIESVVAQGEGFGNSFNEFASWCAERDDCALGDDPEKATEEYHDLVRPLIETNVELNDGRELSYEDATTATVQALYSDSLWSQLNTGLNDLQRQRGDSLMELADMYNERDSDGSYSTTHAAFTAIRCVDDPPVTDEEEIAEAAERYAEAAPFLDPGLPLGDARDSCAFWPAPHTSEPGLPEIDGLPRVLVISTTNDPATPYDAGVRLAEALGASLLTYEGNQHTVFAQQVSCVDDIGVAYLVDLELPEEDVTC